ncbi:MAG: S8 family peptidase [Chloroflexi bacterium]|nr:S8 family peptidase [Chloroflexota bacterium]
MLRKLLVLVMALVLAAPFPQLPLLSPAAAQSPVRTVLVSFDHQPGSQDAAIIVSLGGAVKRTYTIVPTILADISEGQLDRLRRLPGVLRVEDDVPVRALSEVMDWGVDRVDAELIHPTNKGTGIKVAVLDTGIDLSHPDLVVTGNVSFVAGVPTGNDDNGHGTLVAGIIGARDNDIGTIGVAPEAALYAVKVLSSTGGGWVSDIIAGLEWATNNGMQVVNMSLGDGQWPWAGEQALTNASNAGIVLVAGAGNKGNAGGTGNNVVYPALYSTVIAVGATDEQNARLSSSGTGYGLELMAPGNNNYSTALGGGYGYLTQTSASTPHVSGVAALLLKAGFTATSARQRMRDSATDLGAAGWDPQHGQGLVNVYQALNFTEPPDKTAPTTPIVISGTQGNQGWWKSNITVTLPAADNPGGSGVLETRYSLDESASWPLYQSPLQFTTDGQWRLLGRSWDNAGNEEGPPNWLDLRVDKTAPTVTQSVTPTTARRDKPGTLIQIFVDLFAADIPNTSGLVYTNRRIDDEYGVYTVDLGPIDGTYYYSVEQWCQPNDFSGRVYTFTATARDKAGNTTVSTSTFTVTRQ